MCVQCEKRRKQDKIQAARRGAANRVCMSPRADEGKHSEPDAPAASRWHVSWAFQPPPPSANITTLHLNLSSVGLLLFLLLHLTDPHLVARVSLTQYF